MACPTAGMVGCGDGPGTLSFPLCGFEAAGLQEGVGDRRFKAVCRSSGTRARAMRSGSLVQTSGRNSRNPTVTGTSPEASVTETSD